MQIRRLIMAIALSAAGLMAWAQNPPSEKGTISPERLQELGGYYNDFTPGRTPTKEEIAEIEQQVAANPDDFKLVRQLGIGYFYRVFGGNEAAAAPKAQKTLARALELKNDDGLTIAMQGALAYVAGKNLPELKGQHEKLFKKALELEPNNVGILSLASAVFGGNTERAIEYTERIRKLLGPEFKNWSRHGQQRVLMTQGQAYVRAGRREDARATFEEGLRVDRAKFQAELDKLKAADEVRSSADWYKSAYDKRHKGDLDGAIADASEAIKIDPKNAKAWLERGISRNNKKDYEGALKDYDQAVQLDPQNADAIRIRGETKYRQKNFNGALADYDAALKIAPKFSRAYGNRAEAHERLGKVELALADYDRSIELDNKSYPWFIQQRDNLLRSQGKQPAAVLAPATVAAEPATKPNVLFVIADDLNTDLGCYGHRVVQSPNVDRLAAKGVRFDRAYCQLPICAPSRASFLTGLRPETTQVFNNNHHFRKNLPDVVTLPQLFRQHGYFTASLGKVFHRGGSPDEEQADSDDPASWDHRFYGKATETGIRGEGRNLTGGQQPWCRWLAAEGGDDDQHDGQITTESIRLMREQQGQPLFLAVGFYRPHDPFVSPKKYFDRYPLDTLEVPRAPSDRSPEVRHAIPAGGFKDAFDTFTDQERKEFIRAYYAGVSFMDAQLGRLLDALDELKLTDNTIIVLIGDHGYHLGARDWWNKGTLFEKSCRTPLIVHAPGAKGNGQVCRGLVEFVDLYPTLAALCGVAAPANAKLAGTSFRPLLEDPSKAGKRAAFTVVQRGANVMGRTVRTDRWRYTEWADGAEGVELYDHETDPGEWRNLADEAKLSKVRAELRELLHKGNDGWANVLDGKDLTKHWTTSGNWKLGDDGVLALAQREGEKGWQRFEHYLWSKSPLKDFECAFEWKVEKAGHSGFFFHVGDVKAPVAKGIEVQIYDSGRGQGDKLVDHDTGGIIFGNIPGIPPTKLSAKPAGEWNTMSVGVTGNRVVVELNGTVVNDVALDAKQLKDRSATGLIGFQDSGAPIWLRNIRVHDTGALTDRGETGSYLKLDLDRAANEQWGDTAALTRKGPHLEDWRATVDGAEQQLDWARAVAKQHGSEAKLVSVGVGADDWRAVRFDTLPKVVVPVLLVSSDQFHEIEVVAFGTRCLASSMLGVRDWYQTRTERTFRALQPIVIRSQRTSTEWADLSQRTLIAKERYGMLHEAIKEYQKQYPDPQGRFRVVFVPFTGYQPGTDYGNAAQGDFVVVSPRTAAILCPPFAKPSKGAGETMHGIGHELGHTFGLAHTSDVYPNDPTVHQSIMMNGARPPAAILFPKEIELIRKSEFFK